MTVDLSKYLTSIDHIIAGQVTEEDLPKEEIQKKIIRIFRDADSFKNTDSLSQYDRSQLSGLMVKILDITKNPGTNSLAKLWHFIFQGTRRDARAMAAEIIINQAEPHIKSYETAWGYIKDQLHNNISDEENALVKALLAKYRPHGLNEGDLKALNRTQLKHVYALTGELDLRKVERWNFTQNDFLPELMTVANEKKDFKMMKNIFLAAENLPEEAEKPDTNKTIELQKKIIDQCVNISFRNQNEGERDSDYIKVRRDWAFAQIDSKMKATNKDS
jgi:hypothetical protein